MHQYFINYIYCFWLPIAILSPIILPRLDKTTRKALFLSMFIFCWPGAFLMEYVFLWADVWSFSQKWDPLLGIYIFNAPIEEFVYWFGAPWIILYAYLGLNLLDKKYLRRKENA